ncbi:MAG: hypothetical protein FWH57_05700 [Oscillospiraceae bacterium]|nr:hypothetical protein [Oscillospiraceae bacterium]
MKKDFFSGKTCKSLCITLFSIAILLCATACSSRPALPSPEKLIASADNDLDSGNYANALEKYLEYIGIEPEEAYGYISAADAYIGMDNTAQAISILEEGYKKTVNIRILRKLEELEAGIGSARPTPQGSSAQASSSPSSSYAPTTAPVQEPAIATVLLYTVTEVRVASLTPFTIGGISIIDENGDSDYLAGDGNWFINAECVGIDGQNLIFSAEGKECIIGTDLQFFATKTSSGYELLVEDTANAFPQPIPGQPSDSGVFPIQYEAYGHTYSLTGYTIGANEDGNTTVEFSGNGYDVMSFRNGQWAVPAYGECIAGGKTHSAEYYSIGGAGITFIFSGYIVPETITVKNGDTGELIVSFDVEDTPQQ